MRLQFSVPEKALSQLAQRRASSKAAGAGIRGGHCASLWERQAPLLLPPPAPGVASGAVDVGMEAHGLCPSRRAFLALTRVPAQGCEVEMWRGWPKKELLVALEGWAFQTGA